MNTLDYILDRYQLRNTPSPIKTNCSRKGTLSVLFRRLGFKLGVEVGVERAVYSKVICRQNPQLKLYGVDTWAYSDSHPHVSQNTWDSFYRSTKERMKGHNFHIIRDYSVDAAKRFEDESLDFVYIDAEHDYENIKQDIEAWAPKVRKGGMVSGHDYMNGLHGVPYGVKQFVNEWVAKNEIEHLFVFNKVGCPSWMYVKA